VVCAIAERDVDDTVSANLRDACNPTRLQVLSETGYEWRRCGCRGSRILGDMSAKTGINDELASMIWLGEFEEEYTLEK
jgi:hypothetical protein